MLLRYVLPALLVAGLSGATKAREPIRFARTPDISPDGKLVAFSYLGDIWVVPSTGGVARPLTLHESHDLHPVFSPDGRKIAFSSNRYGRYDVFVVPIEGGQPVRITHDSGDDFVCNWSPDGQHLLFASTRLADFPPRSELFLVPATGGNPRQVSAFEGREGAFSPSGKEIVYARGPGTWYRKGYRGSANDDLWICHLDATNNRQLTSFRGQDSWPAWTPDGKHVYYVSEFFGTPANIVRQEIALTEKNGLVVRNPPQQVTFHKDEAVRKARLSANGEWLVYECGPDLWVLSTQSGPPRKLLIEVHADDKSNPDQTITYTSQATELAVAPDEKHLAFVVRGDIFLIPRSGGTAKRLTDSPAQDHGVVWARDGKSLFFLSDRNGHEDIYRLEADDPEHPELVKAHHFKVTAVTSTPEAEMGLNVSPDGKRLSFLRAGKLYTMNLDGTDLRVVVDQPMVIDYEWSPNSKWICYARMDGSFASELYIVPATGPTAADPPRNVTRYATFNAGVTWSRNGDKLAFLSERRNLTGPSLYVLSLQKPAVGASKPTEEIDWDGIHLRVNQVVPTNVDEASIAPDGKRIVFRSRGTEADLWVANVDGSELKRITTGNTRPRQMQWSKLVSGLVYFLDGTGNLRMVNLTPPPGSTATGAVPVPFKARMTIHRDQEFQQVFEQSWRVLYENFYDPGFHGANWRLIREKYRQLVPHVRMKEDLYALITLMLGELNASHLGIAPSTLPSGSNTAELGLLFDSAYPGPGLRIREIIKRGPADRRGLNLNPGQAVLKLDGVPLTPSTELARLLNDKAGETVVLHVSANPADPKATRRLELQPISRPALANLMYERWVDRNFQRVTELSKGKLGYIHIPSMDDAGLDRFVRALYSDNFDKEALVLDVRFNSGGFTHDKVLNYLGGKEHTFFYQRHGGMGTVLRSGDRKWSKPLILLINNRSYSDAEIFPSAFRTLGLGKLVGQPTGGFVIGTTNIKLVDGSMFRVPRTGVFTAKGINMEKEGVVPDILVEPHPDDLARGIDTQLDKSVEVLLQDLALWKKNGGKVTLGPGSNPLPEPGLRPEVRPAPVRPAPPGGLKE